MASDRRGSNSAAHAPSDMTDGNASDNCRTLTGVLIESTIALRREAPSPHIRRVRRAHRAQRLWRRTDRNAQRPPLTTQMQSTPFVTASAITATHSLPDWQYSRAQARPRAAARGRPGTPQCAACGPLQPGWSK